MKKMLLSVAMLTSMATAFAQDVPYILSEVSDNTYAVTMTQEEIAANYDAAWVEAAWGMGVALPANTVMFENDEVTITAGVENTPVYTSSGRLNDMQAEFPSYTGYVNLGSSLPDRGWTGEEQILFVSEVKGNNQGLVVVTPKVNGTLNFGVYAGDNTRIIGIYRLDETNLEDFGWEVYSEFRNDGENGTTLNAPEYVECNVVAGRSYALVGGGTRNLTMHQITFVPEAGSVTPDNPDTPDTPVTPEVPYILSEVAGDTYAVTMTQEEIAANYDAAWVEAAWGMGVALPANTVMYENEEVTITAGVENTPVYTSSGRLNDMQAEFPSYTGYVNLGSSLPDRGWTGEEQILFVSEIKGNNQGLVVVTPKVNGTLNFGVYAGDNTRIIGIYRLDETNLEDFGWEVYSEFRNDGENGTTLNAPEYVECNAVAGRSYALVGGGTRNLTMHQIKFVPETGTGIAGIEAAGEKTVKAYYNLDGTRVNAPVKGIYIVKYSDGTAKKIAK